MQGKQSHKDRCRAKQSKIPTGQSAPLTVQLRKQYRAVGQGKIRPESSSWVLSWTVPWMMVGAELGVSRQLFFQVFSIVKKTFSCYCSMAHVKGWSYFKGSFESTSGAFGITVETDRIHFLEIIGLLVYLPSSILVSNFRKPNQSLIIQFGRPVLCSGFGRCISSPKYSTSYPFLIVIRVKTKQHGIPISRHSDRRYNDLPIYTWAQCNGATW